MVRPWVGERPQGALLWTGCRCHVGGSSVRAVFLLGMAAPRRRSTKHCSHARFTREQTRIYKRDKNLLNVLSIFKTGTMGCEQACLIVNVWAS